jgi:UDP-N-acetylmuramate dehydrogenase
VRATVTEPRRAVALDKLNTLALPATASAMLEVTRDSELLGALEWASEHGLPVVPLGQGSNVVFAGEVDALLLRLCSRGIETVAREGDAVVLRVAAGENWHDLVGWTLEKGYYGLENLALIPGTVGAAPIQNIGAYGVELSSCLQAVHARRVDNGTGVTLSRKDCQLGYRDSVFKGALRDQLVVTAVDLLLSLVDKPRTDYPVLARQLADRGLPAPTAHQVYDAVVSIRSSRLPDPAQQPNAGSFFKNPLLMPGQAAELALAFPGLPRYPQLDGTVKVPAAWLIEYCGFKGACRGAVGVHGEHALVLVNHGGGTGLELLALADEIAGQVEQTFAIHLVIEPRVYGERT